MKLNNYITAALLAVTAIRATAQDVNKLIDTNDVRHIIKTLSADDMQGRATFTPGIEKAAQFIEGEFKSIGLKPLTGDAAYRQNFSMTRSKAIKTIVSINGKVLPVDSVFASTTLPAFDWDNNADVQVVKMTSEMDFRKEYAADLAMGKKMLVLVDIAFTATFNRMVSRAAGGKGTVSFSNADTKPVVFVLGKFDNVKSYSVHYEGKVEQLPLFNIAGVLPGKTKKNEYVIFSGHYDHLGILKPVKGDSIANGADDDASGTTAVITLAKYFKKIDNNERTLVFVAFTAEEIGEYGSTYFSKQMDPAKTMAMFNIEMIGKASKFGPNSAIITGYERSDFGPILQRNLQGTEFKFYPDPYTKQNLFYRSDNASLAKVGVPAHTISTDQIDIDPYYHQVTDELSTLDVANITATIRAIALSSRTIVSGKDTPTRVTLLDAK